MRQVSISDPLFTEAQRAADATGVSMERFVMEAVERHLQDEPTGLIPTPELIAKLRKGQADAQAGLGRTMALVEEALAAKRAAWLAANPH